jgi:hypothetical protein
MAASLRLHGEPVNQRCLPWLERPKVALPPNPRQQPARVLELSLQRTFGKCGAKMRADCISLRFGCPVSGLIRSPSQRSMGLVHSP